MWLGQLHEEFPHLSDDDPLFPSVSIFPKVEREPGPGKVALTAACLSSRRLGVRLRTDFQYKQPSKSHMKGSIVDASFRARFKNASLAKGS